MRRALGLDAENFYLLGHSWGGILAIEYALKYQQHLKGLVISNMMASIPAYNAYAEHVADAGDGPGRAGVRSRSWRRPATSRTRATWSCSSRITTSQHVLRMPADDWPDPVNRAFKHINPAIYVPMQGPSELGASGKLLDWDRTADLGASPSRRW